MFKFVVLAACLVASSQAGVLVGGGSFASSPALGAPLLGKVTYNAAEVSVVKQPVVVDQHENRYRAVPTIVQTAPIVKTTVVQPQPIVQHVVPQTHVVAQPALTYSAAPALAYNGLAYNGLGYNGLAYNGLGYNGLAYNGLGYNGLAFNGLGYGHGFGLHGLNGVVAV